MQMKHKAFIAAIAAAAVGAIAVADVSAHESKRGYGQYGGHMMGMGHGMGPGMGMGKRHHGDWGGRHGRGMGHMMKALAKRYDANKDGKISQEEIDTNRTEWHKKFDTDGDGNLSLKEFESLWLEAKRRQMVREFQRIDEDGSAGISLEEYTEPMLEFVERMDRNGDGVLSRDDHRRRGRGMKQMHQRMMQGDDAGGSSEASEGSEGGSNQ